MDKVQCNTLGVDEMDNSFVLEDVNLLNARNSIYTKSLQSVLQPLVIGSGSFVGRFMLSAKIKGLVHQSLILW